MWNKDGEYGVQMYVYADTVANSRFWSGSMIQNYVQIEAPGTPGSYMAVTCTAKYKSFDDYSDEVDVQNSSGDVSITVSALPNVRWD